MLLLLSFFPPIAITVIASPTPADNSPAPDASILTSFKFTDCSHDDTKTLNQNVKDAVTLASAGLDYINDELLSTYPQYGHQQVNFSKQAAIDFFDAMLKAANSYPGWGLSDWWNKRYVQLSCKDEKNECKDNSAAYFYRSKHDYGYPLVVVCPGFFKKLSSHDDVVAKIDGNKDLQQNVANMRSRATTFLHELLHINWGTAQVCSGKDACTDHFQVIGKDGKEPVKTYKTGRSKLLAQRNVKDASSNNDNLAYYAMAKFMEKRWKKYSKYPTVWDPTKSRQENRDRDSKQPGAPSPLDTLDEEHDDGPGSPMNDPIYPFTSYPDWYQPLIKATFNDLTPDLTQPSHSGINYIGPDMKTEVTCETTDASPEVQDCIHAFGSLRVGPKLRPLHGKKDGTWWAGYVNSCALAIYYREDWTDDCQATMKDVDDYASAIFEGCQNPGNGKVGGKAEFGMDKCAAQIEVITNSGEPPQGKAPGS